MVFVSGLANACSRPRFALAIVRMEPSSLRPASGLRLPAHPPRRQAAHMKDNFNHTNHFRGDNHV